MRFPIARSAIIILGAGVLAAVPTVMLLGGKPARTSAVVAPAAVAPDRNDPEFKFLLKGRVAPATPAATPTAPGSLPSPTRSPVKPAAAPTRSTVAPPPVPAVPSFSHVFVIVMENHEYGSIIGSSAAPYINSLASTYALATNYYGASHPSLPNYLALTAGSTFGIASDCTTCFVGATNIADQVEASGRSWKAYMEDMPSPCFTGASAGNYAMKHDPFMYYNDIRTNAARCAAHVVPFSQFSGDMSSGQVPNFVWITPNMCNDMHDCAVATGDAWLRSVVPTITGSAAFRNGGVPFITLDEGSRNAGGCGTTSGGPVVTLGVLPRPTSRYRSRVAENHYGRLRAVVEAFRLSHLGAAASAANVPLREYFR